MRIKKGAKSLIDEVYRARQFGVGDNHQTNYRVNLSVLREGNLPYVEQIISRSDGGEVVSYYRFSLYKYSPWFTGRAVTRTEKMVGHVAKRLRSEGLEVNVTASSLWDKKYIKRNSLQF
jgi:hypothetical protein